MSFIDQAEKIFGNATEFRFQVVMFGREGIYIEGARPVKIDACEMMFKIRDALLYVGGKDLTVKEITGDCISVVGQIDGVWVREL